MKTPLLLLAVLAAPAFAQHPSSGCPDEDADVAAQLKGLNGQLKDLAPLMGPRLGVMVDTDLPKVEVLGVTPDGPAERAGVRSGDVLISVDGATLAHDGAMTLGKVLRTHKVGDSLKVELKRDAEVKTVVIVLDDARVAMKKQLELELSRNPGPQHASWRELRLAAVNPELGAYFGVSDGVLVLSTPKGGEPPLKAGDVIVRIGEKEPKSPTEAARLLRSFEPGQKITIEVMRQKQLQALSVTTP